MLVIEPDSLPNLATNTDDAHCGNTATMTAYKSGIKYAVETLGGACSSSCSLYLDAAHGGWLGWSDNMDTFSSLVADLSISTHLRGFSTNVANWESLPPPPGLSRSPSLVKHALTLRHDGGHPTDQTIGTQCNSSVDCILGPGTDDDCCSDPCSLLSQWNRANK